MWKLLANMSRQDWDDTVGFLALILFLTGATLIWVGLGG